MMKSNTKYIPKLTRKEIEENHLRFFERKELYKGKGIDYLRSRNFILEKASPMNGDILELGSGTGHTTIALAKAGYKFISIDRDVGSLRTAALNVAYEDLLSHVEFHQMDGTKLDFDEESFDNVIAVNLFHHIENIDGVLAEIDRVLRPLGKVILADFNQRGMEIVNGVHKDEGHAHEDSGIGREDIGRYFSKLGYYIKNYDDDYHWLLVAEKGKKSNL